MLKVKHLFAVGLGLVIASGCAPAYNCYECGCTRYEYCRQPALPYTAYHSCCPTPIAGSFSGRNVHIIDASRFTAESLETPTPAAESP